MIAALLTANRVKGMPEAESNFYMVYLLLYILPLSAVENQYFTYLLVYFVVGLCVLTYFLDKVQQSSNGENANTSALDGKACHFDKRHDSEEDKTASNYFSERRERSTSCGSGTCHINDNEFLSNEKHEERIERIDGHSVIAAGGSDKTCRNTRADGVEEQPNFTSNCTVREVSTSNGFLLQDVGKDAALAGDGDVERNYQASAEDAEHNHGAVLNDPIEAHRKNDSSTKSEKTMLCHLVSEPPACFTPTCGNVLYPSKVKPEHVLVDHSKTFPNERVLLLVGATGGGKTTLINGLANYILGVEWEDDFRYELIPENNTKSQAHSQTSSITTYTFQNLPPSRLQYTLTVIDTPGFGDTRGLEADQQISSKFKDFFSNTQFKKLHGIGFVAQAPSARLTAAQKYIFDLIIQLFGKNAVESIILMATFADCNKPPLLSAIKQANLPCKTVLKFNNSVLYLPNKEEKDDESQDLIKLYWTMGMKCYSALCRELEVQHEKWPDKKSRSLPEEVVVLKKAV